MLLDGKIAFIFPGQGSQYLGMGKEFYDRYSSAKKIFDKAEEILGYSLKRIIFQGPLEKLTQTQITQPAVFTTSVACLEVAKERDFPRPAVVAGHSLGEYSALVAGEAIDFPEGLKLVQKRGEIVQQVSEENPGGMLAIIGLDRGKVTEICQRVETIGLAQTVNFNCPGQTVISGEKKALEKVQNLAQEEGAKRAVFLSVSGPFHSSLMKKASYLLAQELKKFNFQEKFIPLVCNYKGDFILEASQIKEALIGQIDHPVVWEDSMEKISSSGVDTFIEIGPGRILSGLLKRINPQVKCLNIEDEKSLNKTLEELKKGMM